MKPFGRILLVLSALALVFALASCSLLGLGNSGRSDNPETTSLPDEISQPAYTITYILGNGSSNTVIYHSTDPDYVPEDPVRNGYRFLYWTLDGKDGQYNGVVLSGSSGNITFRAVWELIEYTLTYVGADDTTDNPSSYNIESDDIVLSEPVKSGYYFLGWQSEDGQLKKEMTIPKGSTGNLVFVAKWSATNATFKPSANIDAPITTSIGEEYLETDTPIRVTAPVYLGDKMFSHWEINGTKVSETAFYTFPMPAYDTEIKAIYVTLEVISYDKASGAAQSVAFSSKPTFCFGGNAKAGTDVTLDAEGVTFTADYLASLDPGDYRFYLATVTAGEVTADKTFTLRISDRTNTLKTEPDYSGLTDTAKTYYDMPTFTYGGKTYHRVASTEEEFRAMVEYFVFVEGALQMQRDNDKTREYTFQFYMIGNFETLSAHVSDISFPMHPSISYQRSGVDLDREAVVTVTVKYQHGLNETISTQEKTVAEDLQNLLTSPGRAADYDNFKIDALTETAEIRTLYELEVLPFGRKPIFADSATDAKTVYDAARAILRAIIDDGMDDYAKVTAIYAWLGENLTYDDVTLASNDSSVSAYTVKGALIDRVAVCDGYASAFRLLCQIEGIRAEEVTGVNELGKSNTGHAWNKVWIGGAVYGVDSTWARVSIGETSLVTLRYLFLDERSLLQSNHYENATPNDPSVATLADANIFIPKAVAFNKETLLYSLKYDFSIDSIPEFHAMVEYLKNKHIAAAEFYLANQDLHLNSTSEYSVTVPKDGYVYILFE